jgi:hypothetical protein
MSKSHGSEGPSSCPSMTNCRLQSVRPSGGVLSLLCVVLLASGATATTNSGGHNITSNNNTVRRRMQSCANATCDSGQVLTSDHTDATNASKCCTCPPGTVTNYADESLAFRFRADGITHDNGSLVWNAVAPSGLAFTILRADCDVAYAYLPWNVSGQCDDSVRQGPTIATTPEGLPSGLLFSYFPARGLAENMFSTQSVALGAKHTFFAAVTLAAGEMLMIETLVGFVDVEFAWYLGFMNAAEGAHGVVNADQWDVCGFTGPSVRPEVMQLIIARSRYGTTAGGFDGPIVEMAVLDVSAPLQAVEWTSTLYGLGIVNYHTDTNQAFDLDFRDPEFIDAFEQNHAFAAGRMIIGSHLTIHVQLFQLRGTLHHLELHSDTLTNAQVAVVVRKLRHTVSPNSAPDVPACDDCEAGTRDDDSNPATACEQCDQGTFSDQPAVTECVGTCGVGSTILSAGATSNAACSQCAVGQYGFIRESVAVCQPCEPGRFSTQVGASSSASCAGCAPGTFSAPGSTGCAPSGCMDDWADNYNPAAEVDEGRCVYTCSRLREHGGTGARVPGGCLVYDHTHGWQRYGHNNSALAGGTFAEIPTETWVVQGLAAPGSITTAPVNIADYPTTIVYDGGGNFTVRHILTVQPCTSSAIHRCSEDRNSMSIAATAGPGSVTIAHILTGGSRRLFFEPGAQVHVSDSIIARGWSAESSGGLYNMGGDATFLRVRFEDNEASHNGGAAGFTLDGTGTFESCAFTGNRAVMGGAIYMEDGSVAVSNSLFRDNVATQTGGAIEAAADAALSIELTDFLRNDAAGDGAALHTTNPLSLKIVHTSFSPFLDGAATVFIAGRLGGCAEHPCDSGYACSYDRYSTTCVTCEYPLVSADGLSCGPCPAGSGPNIQLTNCTECADGEYSPLGVCLTTPARWTNNADHTDLVDVDECALNDGGCDPIAVKIGSCDYAADGFEVNCQSPCKNEYGSFRCGPCPGGFLRSAAWGASGQHCVLPPVDNTTASAGTVRPETTLEVTPPDGFDTATQQQELFDDAISQLAATLLLRPSDFEVSFADTTLRGLQILTSGLMLTVSITSSDAPTKMAELSAHLHDANGTLVSGGLFPVQQLDIAYVCPPGMTRPEGEAVCRKCVWPQFTPDRIRCEHCPVWQSPTPLGNGCQCADDYYSVDMEQLECVLDANGYHGATVVGTGCQPCPDCATCDGPTPPKLKAGFVEMDSSVLDRNLLPTGVRVAFQCDLRTDHEASPACLSGGSGFSRLQVGGVWPACAAGYEGYFCQSCAEGNRTVNRECLPCKGPASAGSYAALAVLSAVAGAIIGLRFRHHKAGSPVTEDGDKNQQFSNPVAVQGAGQAETNEPNKNETSVQADGERSRVWQLRFRIAYRTAFQPMRMVVTWAQVTSQIGSVLHVHYPPVFRSAVDTLRFLQDIWGIFLDSECSGMSGFKNQWLLKAAVPLGVLAVAVLYAIVQNASAGKSFVFGLIFLLYPTIVNTALASAECRELVPHHRVLEADDRLLCSSYEVETLQLISAVIIVVFALGVPVGFSLLLVQNAREYERLNDGPENAVVVARLAGEFDVDSKVAEFILRDVTSMGQDFAFLMDAYSFRHYYWESLDLVRKLLLVGLVLLVGRGSVAQNNVALLLSFGFFALQVRTWPYKLHQDNIFRTATEMHVFLVIAAGLALRNDLSSETVSAKGYDWGLFLSFLVLVPGAFVITVIWKFRSAQEVMSMSGIGGSFHRLRFGLASDADRAAVRQHVQDVRLELDPTVKGKQVWLQKKLASHLTREQMEATLKALEGDLLKSESLGFHFTNLDSARLILDQGKGIRASKEGQLGGGVSICVKGPEQLGWEANCTEDASPDAFPKKVGDALWGTKWYEVMPGPAPQGEHEHWGTWKHKLEVMLIVKIPTDKNQKQFVPGRDAVYILPVSTLLPEGDGKNVCYSNANILEAFVLKSPDEQGRELVETLTQGTSSVHYSSKRDRHGGMQDGTVVEVVLPEDRTEDVLGGGPEAPWAMTVLSTTAVVCSTAHAPDWVALHRKQEQLKFGKDLWVENVARFTAWELGAALDSIDSNICRAFSLAFYFTTKSDADKMCEHGIRTADVPLIVIPQPPPAEGTGFTPWIPLALGWEPNAGGDFIKGVRTALDSPHREVEVMLILSIPTQILLPEENIEGGGGWDGGGWDGEHRTFTLPSALSSSGVFLPAHIEKAYQLAWPQKHE